MGSAETSLKSKTPSYPSGPCSEGAFHMTLRQPVWFSQLKFAMTANAAAQRHLHLVKYDHTMAAD